MALDTRVTTNGTTVTVAFSGELDISRAEEVERELERIEAEGPDLIVFDLRGLEFLDSTGLRLILGADSRGRREGRRVVIVPGPEIVHRVFRSTLLDNRLEFAESPEAVGGPGDDAWPPVPGRAAGAGGGQTRARRARRQRARGTTGRGP